MPRRKTNGNGHSDTPVMDKGSGVAGKRGRGRPKRDPADDVVQMNHPSQAELDKFLAVFRTRKKESQEANHSLGEHFSHAIKTQKWNRRALRFLAMLSQLTPLEAQATIRWLTLAFAKTEHGRQGDLLDDVVGAARRDATAEAETEPATI